MKTCKFNLSKTDAERVQQCLYDKMGELHNANCADNPNRDEVQKDIRAWSGTLRRFRKQLQTQGRPS